jgi:hypothetical protein
VPEIRLPDTRRDNEVIVGHRDLLAEWPPADQALPGDVHVGGLRLDALKVGVVPEQVPQRCGDLALGQDAGGALVQQRLEDMLS